LMQVNVIGRTVSGRAAIVTAGCDRAVRT
jgi:hypothetical protein